MAHRSGSGSVVPGLAESESPGNLLGMESLRSYSRCTLSTVRIDKSSSGESEAYQRWRTTGIPIKSTTFGVRWMYYLGIFWGVFCL
jgi:hypothetical protein